MHHFTIGRELNMPKAQESFCYTFLSKYVILRYLTQGRCQSYLSRCNASGNRSGTRYGEEGHATLQQLQKSSDRAVLTDICRATKAERWRWRWSLQCMEAILLRCGVAGVISLANNVAGVPLQPVRGSAPALIQLVSAEQLNGQCLT